MKVVCNFKNRTLDYIQPVRVFRNLSPQYRNSPVYSVQQKRNGAWTTILHVTSIDLHCCSFKVSQTGVDRIRKKERKEVVATVHGFVTFREATPEHTLYFNPYLYDCFVTREVGNPKEEHPVVHAARVSFLHNDRNFPNIIVENPQ